MNSILTYGVLLILSIGLFFAAGIIIVAGCALYAITYVMRNILDLSDEALPLVIPS